MKWMLGVSVWLGVLVVVVGCTPDVPETAVFRKPVPESLCQPDAYHVPGCECPPYCVFPDSANVQFVVTFLNDPPDGDDGNPFIIPFNTVHTDSLGRKPPKPQYDGHDWDSTLTFTVEVDTNGHAAPSVRLHLAVATVDSDGTGSDSAFGHYHHSATVPKPAGGLSDTVITTDATTGKVTVSYTPGQYAEPVTLVLSSPATDSTLARHWTVGITGLVPVSGTHLHLIGDTTLLGARHPHSHFAVAGMIPVLSMLADSFYTWYGSNLQVNDMSLPFGGKFDLDTLWYSDVPHVTCRLHCEHRLGRSADVDDLSTNQRINVRRIWESDTTRFVFKESSHYHLRYWTN